MKLFANKFSSDAHRKIFFSPGDGVRVAVARLGGEDGGRTSCNEFKRKFLFNHNLKRTIKPVGIIFRFYFFYTTTYTIHTKYIYVPI